MVPSTSHLVLAGRLEAIPLADVLQLLAMGQRDGIVEIEHEDTGAAGEIVFAGGRVARVDIDERPDPIGAILLRQGSLDPDTLTDALLLQSATTPWRRLGEVLFGMRAIERGVLVAALREQMEENLVILLGWEKGVFRFKLETEPDTPMDAAIDARQLLLDALRRRDEARRSVSV